MREPMPGGDWSGPSGDREHRALGTVVPRLVSNSGTSRQSNILQAYNPARRQRGTMCKVSRRELLIGGGAFLSLAAETDLLARPMPGMSQAVREDLVAPDVYFHEGSDTADAVCNNGWIMFEDYVLVIDANFPAGAKLMISKIRALTDKPIRFAFDTHHHGDHAYGNQIFVENGGVPVAHTGVVEEMKQYETGYYGNQPGRWEAAIKDRPDLKTTKLKPPSVLFSKDLIFDDGKHRVELMHLVWRIRTVMPSLGYRKSASSSRGTCALTDHTISWETGTWGSGLRH